MESTHIEWHDTDGDGYQETSLVDVDADGRTDLQFTDLDFDGTANSVLGDTDADGVADFRFTQPVSTAPAVSPIFDTTAGSSVGDAAFTAASGPFPVSSDTQALIGSLNSQMADANTVYRSAMDPGSVDAGTEAAATERLNNAGRMADALQGQVAAQEIANDVRHDEIARAAMTAAHETATDTWIESERATSAAEWAVWESESAR